MNEKIIKIIDNIKPSIQNHGGDIEFVKYDEKKKIIEVRLSGACSNCPMSYVTLENKVLSEIKKKFPDIKEVKNVN